MNKDKYKIVNWPAYNAGLKERGKITIWLSEAVVNHWRQRGKSFKRGREQTYSDLAILTCLTVRKVYHLALRQCEGFVNSFFEKMGLCVAAPSYTTLCRRAGSLEVQLSRLSCKGVTDIAVDSTGLKVYGEGEWKVRKHGWSKHRTWMKLHVCVDVSTQQIEAIVLSNNSVDDAQVVKEILGNVSKNKQIKSFRGDGAYDKEKVRKQLWQEGIEQVIPPQHNAVKNKAKKQWMKSRDQSIKKIKKIGRTKWKQSVGYHKRSLSETAMYRYKTIIGDRLQSRQQHNQIAEAKISCRILNDMILLAKPITLKVA